MRRQARTHRTNALQATRKLPGVVRVWTRCGVICTERWPVVLPMGTTFTTLAPTAPDEWKFRVKLFGKYEGPIDAPGGHPGEKW